LAVVSAGGAIGALARWGIASLLPARTGGFPWATFITNAAGCLLIGALMVLVTEVWNGRRLIRPFLGVGVLGGFTTFSTYVVDIQRLLAEREAATALGYLAGTMAVALAATWVGTVATQGFIHRRGSR
jgi:CrcB protein